MMMGNHRTPCTFTMHQIGRWVVAHFKAIPTFMVIALLSLGNNVFVDSLFEPALEPSICTLGSLRISSMAYQ